MKKISAQEQYYKNKLDRQYARKLFYKACWKEMSVTAQAVGIVIAILTIIVGISGGLTCLIDRSRTMQRIQNLEDKVNPVWSTNFWR